MYTVTQTQTALPLRTAHFTQKSHELADILERYPQTIGNHEQDPLAGRLHGWGITFLSQMLSGERTGNVERLRELVTPHFARFEDLVRDAPVSHRFAQEMIAWRGTAFSVVPVEVETREVVIRMPPRTQNGSFSPADILAMMRQMRENLIAQTSNALAVSAASQQQNEMRLVEAREQGSRHEAELIEGLQRVIDECSERVNQVTREMETDRNAFHEAMTRSEANLAAAEASNAETARMIRAEMDEVRAQAERTQAAKEAQLQTLKDLQAQKEQQLRTEQAITETRHQLQVTEIKSQSDQAINRLEGRVSNLVGTLTTTERALQNAQTINQQQTQKNAELTHRNAVLEARVAYEQQRADDADSGSCSLL